MTPMPTWRPPRTTLTRKRRPAPNWRDSDAFRSEYKAFTTVHDEVKTADELCDPEELTRLRAYLDAQLQGLQAPRRVWLTACNDA